MMVLTRYLPRSTLVCALAPLAQAIVPASNNNKRIISPPLFLIERLAC
jgi:hypothetical protein